MIDGSGPPSRPGPHAVQEVAEALRRARGVVLLTGAGVSAESGVPTFRERRGLWARYDPAELATPEAFSRDPRKVWEWYHLRRRAVLECDPNPGHRAIAHLLRTRADATLVTQNVDGLHQRALRDLEEGTSSPASSPGDRILELHGSLLRLKCSGCDMRIEDDGPIDTAEPGCLPVCVSCGELLRPDVVWFGELLDAGVLDAAFAAAREADLCLVVGTSAVVHPAASIPLAAMASGCDLIEVNPEATPLSPRARWTFREASGIVLPAILEH